MVDASIYRIYKKAMDIEFDRAKDASNRDKHGVSLAFGEQVFGDDDRIVIASHRPVDGEDRFKVVGLVDGKLWTAVYVMRGTAVRFVSVRRSNDGEERAYRA
jgi:hypothetical protein